MITVATWAEGEARSEATAKDGPVLHSQEPAFQAGDGEGGFVLFVDSPA